MAGRLLDRLKLIIRSELFDVDHVGQDKSRNSAMDETLEDLKSELGQAIAERHNIRKSITTVTTAGEEWDTKANLALEHGREDLAKAALTRKHSLDRELTKLETQSARMSDLIAALEKLIGGMQSSAPDNQAISAQLAELDALIARGEADKKTD